MEQPTPTIEELKARAYDLIATKERIEMSLRQVNQQIGLLLREEQEKKAKAIEKPKKEVKKQE